MSRLSRLRSEEVTQSLQDSSRVKEGGGVQPAELIKGEHAGGVDLTVVLRPYRPADLPALTELDALCFSKEFLFGEPLMRVLAETALALTLLAETSDGQLTGFGIAHWSQESAPDAAYLVTLDVAPDYRRRQVGRRLLQLLEQSMAEHGAQRMDLHVHTENGSAILFYEQQGYRRRGRIPNFYGVQRRDAYLYSKDLRPTPIDAGA